MALFWAGHAIYSRYKRRSVHYWGCHVWEVTLRLAKIEKLRRDSDRHCARLCVADGLANNELSSLEDNELHTHTGEAKGTLAPGFPHANLAAVAPITIPASRPSLCRVPPGMRYIHPHTWQRGETGCGSEAAVPPYIRRASGPSFARVPLGMRSEYNSAATRAVQHVHIM